MSVVGRGWLATVVGVMAAVTPAPVAPPAEERRRTLAHVPALDGLRAVAVVGVMLFHGGVSWMPGGFLGVDVFFVLSGYLITTLLLRERVLSGRVDLRAFWNRRLRRLLPALLVLLAGVSVAAPFLGDPAQRAQLRGDGLASLLYVANWRFILTEQSYFAGTPSPLRHLWSLSVEEQWYVVFPLVAALALGHLRKRRLQVFTGALAVAALASAGWMAHLASGPGDPSRAYYGTDTRAHSLLVGAVLACVAVLVPAAPLPQGARRRRCGRGRPRPARLPDGGRGRRLDVPRWLPRPGPRHGRPGRRHRHPPPRPARWSGCSRSGRWWRSARCPTACTCGTGR